jgi:hypothetical protein
MSNQDYEVDNESGVSQMKRTSPGGAEITMTAYKPCDICDAHCDYRSDACMGQVTAKRNPMTNDIECHECEQHKTPEGRYYESAPQEKNGPLQRMIS